MSKETGELYVLTDYRKLMGEIAHIYIYQSLDYGETFTVYHPFSYGEEPYYSGNDRTYNAASGPFGYSAWNDPGIYGHTAKSRACQSCRPCPWNMGSSDHNGFWTVHCNPVLHGLQLSHKPGQNIYFGYGEGCERSS